MNLQKSGGYFSHQLSSYVLFGRRQLCVDDTVVCVCVE